MPSEIERTLAALGEARVRYLVVGGVAVVLHGYLRVTADLDLAIDLEPDNVRRAVAVFARIGLRPRAPVALAEFADPEVREGWVRDRGLTVFSLWSPELPGFEVDLFAREPFDFEAVYSRAARVALASCTATVISRPDLIVLKRQAGRPRDQEDVAALQALGEEADDDEG